jgi:hypothetical protein
MNAKSLNQEAIDSNLQAVAEKIRAAYLESAINSYDDAAADGLCAEGAWECAVDAMRHVEIIELLQELASAMGDQSSSRLPSGSRR